MSFPMTTVEVLAGPAVGIESGDDVSLTVEVTAVAPAGTIFKGLVWTATGDRFSSFRRARLILPTCR